MFARPIQASRLVSATSCSYVDGVQFARLIRPTSRSPRRIRWTDTHLSVRSSLDHYQIRWDSKAFFSHLWETMQVTKSKSIVAISNLLLVTYYSFQSEGFCKLQTVTEVLLEFSSYVRRFSTESSAEDRFGRLRAALNEFQESSRRRVSFF